MLSPTPQFPATHPTEDSDKAELESELRKVIGTMLDHDHEDPDTVIQHLHGLTDPSKTASYDPQVVQTRAMALFGQLKAHNRAANAQTRSHKQATADACTQMDQAHLALQNLLYEKRHLEREIEKCRQFA